MPLLDLLSREDVWEAFYNYRTSLICSKNEEKELRGFIDRRAYGPVCAKIASGGTMPLPRRAVISKMHSGKKRTVYIYPEPENTVFKLLTWLLLRQYDGLFSPNLYSFRPGRTAKDAVRHLLAVPGIRGMYAYKVDISNYFNSVDIRRFLPVLEEALKDDPELCRFLCGLLLEPEVRDGSGLLTEQKGIMAGTPQSSFYANLYLKELDRAFYERGIPYARYSDDMIVFAPGEQEVHALAEEIRNMLAEKGLGVNPAKESFSAPEEGWTFLGFCCKDGVIDIAPATADKLKAKMRRKTRALARWRDRSGHTGEQAAKAFIRVFNRKLLESPMDRELSWSHWFFSLINTTDTLQAIDRYAQDCLRVLISGRHTKARYNVRYEQLKALGYRSLVHAYYEHEKQDDPEPSGDREG
ncbi:MAG: group II intron reverse transcriptase domain-containing protein [Lachnospiraceae bacterium]|nr:group II intron reverse transcriptase domain-containing protein [Lachnospiraceae bacterium]